MKRIIIIFLIIGLLLLAGIYLSSHQKTQPKQDLVYSGPVRPTDDEAHFRKTGQTIPLEEKD